MDALERLMAIAEQELTSDPEEKEVNPLTKLSKRELRRRFDENGDPRKGFDIDGNPVISGVSNEPVKASKDGLSKRKTR